MRIDSTKLQLNRETVYRLDNETLSQARGGADVGKVSTDNRQCTNSQQCQPAAGNFSNPPGLA